MTQNCGDFVLVFTSVGSSVYWPNALFPKPARVRKGCLLSSDKSSSSLRAQSLQNLFQDFVPCSFYMEQASLFVCVGFPLGYPAQHCRRPRRLTLRLSPTITSLHCSRRDWRRKVESCDCSKQVAVQHFWSRDVEFDSFSWPCCGAATRTWRQTLTANSQYLFVSPKVHLNQIQNLCIMISPETAL